MSTAPATSIPCSGQWGFLCEDTFSFLPTQPGSLDLGNNRRNPVGVPLLESHGSVSFPSPGHAGALFWQWMRFPGHCPESKQVPQHWQHASIHPHPSRRCRGLWDVSGVETSWSERLAPAAGIWEASCRGRQVPGRSFQKYRKWSAYKICYVFYIHLFKSLEQPCWACIIPSFFFFKFLNFYFLR